jgi:hypothetical protein
MSLPVEVAHLEFGVSPAPVKQVVADTRPAAFAERQPVPVAKNNCVVDAFWVKRVVEVPFVVVLFWPVKFWRVEEPVARKLAMVA